MIFYYTVPGGTKCPFDGGLVSLIARRCTEEREMMTLAVYLWDYEYLQQPLAR